MIVVSDTTPLNYLILIGEVELLPKLFGDVIVPPAVIRELLHPKAPHTVQAWAALPPSWIRLQAPMAIHPSTVLLDPGETEAISLAAEIKADLILIDERRATRVAQQAGLVVVRTVALLETAADRGLIDLANTFKKLAATSFRVPNEQVAAALVRDAQRKASRKTL